MRASINRGGLRTPRGLPITHGQARNFRFSLCDPLKRAQSEPSLTREPGNRLLCSKSRAENPEGPKFKYAFAKQECMCRSFKSIEAGYVLSYPRSWAIVTTCQVAAQNWL